MVKVRLTDGATVCIEADKFYTQSGGDTDLLIVETKNRNNVIFNFKHVAYVAYAEDIAKEGDEDD